MKIITLNLNSTDSTLFYTKQITQGENLSTQLNINLTPEFQGYKYLIVFQNNENEPIPTEELTAVDNVVSYLIPAPAIKDVGVLKIELQAYDLDTGFLIKASTSLKINESIYGFNEVMPEVYVPWYILTLEQAGIATDKATISTEQATISTEQAVIATNKAIIATEQADIAIAKAEIATNKSTTATEQAVISTNKATIATQQATIATTKATEALASKNAAAISATTATNKATEASTSATQALGYKNLAEQAKTDVENSAQEIENLSNQLNGLTFTIEDGIVYIDDGM